MRICTKHCVLIALIAASIVLALRSVEAPLHIPFGQTGDCASNWFGWPLGYLADSRECLTRLQFGLQYFANGLLNVLIFFVPLTYLHKQLLHRSEGRQNR